MKKNIIIALVISSLAVGLTVFIYLYFSEAATSARRFDNLQAATAKIEQFTARDNQAATRTKAQNLTNMELRKAFPEVTQQLKNLYIPPRLAESYTQASTAMRAEISAPIKTIVPDRLQYTVNADQLKPIPVKSFQFSDKWLSVSGKLDIDTVKITVAAVDTIFAAIYRGPRRHPLLWIFSKRQLEVSATNRSPYIKTTVIQAGIIKH